MYVDSPGDFPIKNEGNRVRRSACIRKMWENNVNSDLFALELRLSVSLVEMSTVFSQLSSPTPTKIGQALSLAVPHCENFEKCSHNYNVTLK